MSEVNNDPIDIVVPWVNPNDEAWKAEFNFWKKKETGMKDACRYNDWGFLRYVFRSISANCPWCRYVFLVLASETQIPAWLKKDCPKLKTVYHKDYIPSEFLPTFNSNVIEMFYGNISELSDNFILINDDMIFTSKMDEDFYFKNNKPVYKPGNRIIYNSPWDKMIRTSAGALSKLFDSGCPIYNSYHMPLSCKKSMFLYIMAKLNKEIYTSLKTSRFRHSYNMMHFTYFFATQLLRQCEYDKRDRGRYIELITGRNINLNGPAVCINENERTFPGACKSAVSALNKKFPNKCEFEN